MNKIVKNFNKLLKNTIFKVQNKTNNNLEISTFNKFLITFIAVLFLYIFYLMLPLLYDKNWVKNNIQTKLLAEFKIDLNSIDDISYRILPAPHFLIKDSMIASNSSKNEKPIAEIKDLMVFLDQMNFFNKEKMSIIEVIIDNANFSLLGNNLKLLNGSTINKFTNKKVIIKKSNIFLKNNLDEITTIIKVNKANFFFNEKKLQNQFDIKGNIFTTPFIFELKTKNDLFIEKKFLFKTKTLNLEIFNNHIIKKNNSTIGNNIITFLNSSIESEYEFTDKKIIFTSKNSRIHSSKINYDGELSINPFDLDLHVSLNSNKISKLFNLNSILVDFLKSGLLFNENISLNTSITVNSNRQDDFFDNAKIYLSVLNGKINFDNTKFVNNEIGSLKLNDSSLFLQDNKLILNTTLFFDVKNSDRLFSFLNTSKSLRKNIKKIIVNIDYDFVNNKIQINNVKIDNNETNDQFMNIIDGFNDNNLNNLVKTRRLLNKLLSAYEG
tara:strand:+ start:477 stop:1961 length:1485 start_codon:yes stop_codon:yes gene_type:complete